MVMAVFNGAFGQMLNNGYEVIRTDEVPGTVDGQSNMMFPPSTVYILRKNIRRLE